MPKVSQLRTAGELADPEIRREQGRTALAHAVAMRVGYRVDQGLSQSGLARLEAGDHEPSLATLSRLARVLGLEFHIDITPDSFALRDTA
jgi:transcriptional regulator with XRE-family HTH domain